MRNIYEKIKNIIVSKCRKIEEYKRIKYLRFFKLKYRDTNLLNNNKRERKIIVSLTSYPARIETLDLTILSMLAQKKTKADKIILWLADSQFPGKTLPKQLNELIKMGLEIKWCEDLKSYKKLIPSLLEYPEDVIVTADDDVLYDFDWLNRLYESYLDNKDMIHCHRITRFKYNSDEFDAVFGGRKYANNSSYLNKLVGIGGVLYPPHIFDKRVTNVNLFKKLAPTNDDIWFWLMAVLNDTQIKCIKNNNPEPIDITQTKNNPGLTNVNDAGDNLFWKDFNSCLSYFPELKEKLINCQ